MPFAPGQRKIGGRTKGVPNRVTCEVKAAARKAAIPAMKEIIKLALYAENPFVRLAACREVLDRAIGKPAREVVADDSPPVIKYILSWRTKDSPEPPMAPHPARDEDGRVVLQ